MALLRNALTGLYCTFPKFFDKLSDSKSNLSEKRNQNLGIIFWILSLFIPNVKPLCDIAEDKKGSPAYFFTKALWQGTIAVVIGTTIYNGYYRDLIGIGANLGAHIMSEYILAIDFNSFFDDIAHTGAKYSFAYNEAAPGGKERTALAKTVYDSIMNYYKNKIRDTESRAVVGRNVETIIQERMKAIPVNNVEGFSNMWDLLSNQEFRISQEVRIVPDKPTELDMGNLPPYIKMGQFIIPVSEFGGKTPQIPETNAYMHVIVQATQKESKVSNALSKVDIQVVYWEEEATGTNNRVLKIMLVKGSTVSTNNLRINGVSFKPAGTSGLSQIFETSINNRDRVLSSLITADHSEIKYSTTSVNAIYLRSGTMSDSLKVKISSSSDSDWVDELSVNELKVQKSKDSNIGENLKETTLNNNGVSEFINDSLDKQTEPIIIE